MQDAYGWTFGIIAAGAGVLIVAIWLDLKHGWSRTKGKGGKLKPLLNAVQQITVMILFPGKVLHTAVSTAHPHTTPNPRLNQLLVSNAFAHSLHSLATPSPYIAVPLVCWGDALLPSSQSYGPTASSSWVPSSTASRSTCPSSRPRVSESKPTSMCALWPRRSSLLRASSSPSLSPSSSPCANRWHAIEEG